MSEPKPCQGCGYVIRCKCVPVRYADNLTNLTDEGLRDLLLAWDENIDNFYAFVPEDAMKSLIELFKQVRDAAKKEERERCAKVVEGKEMVGEGYGVLHLGGWNQAIKVAVTAIRQMEGGK